jgi:hypothetical protein
MVREPSKDLLYTALAEPLEWRKVGRYVDRHRGAAVCSPTACHARGRK